MQGCRADADCSFGTSMSMHLKATHKMCHKHQIPQAFDVQKVLHVLQKFGLHAYGHGRLTMVSQIIHDNDGGCSFNAYMTMKAQHEQPHMQAQHVPVAPTTEERLGNNKNILSCASRRIHVSKNSNILISESVATLTCSPYF